MSNDDFSWEDQVGARRFRLRPRHIGWSRFVGLLVSQLAGLGALALVTLIYNQFDWDKMTELQSWTGGILGFSQFLLIFGSRRRFLQRKRLWTLSPSQARLCSTRLSLVWAPPLFCAKASFVW